ncbi:MAG: family 16 glycoside hydrolase [Vicinamibacterales bacterium]
MKFWSLPGTGLLLAIAAMLAVDGEFNRASTQATGVASVSFTSRQASRGAPLYAAHCAQCHGVNLEGTDFAPGLQAPELLSRWKHRTVPELLKLMQATMPLTSPGGLSAQQNADILAYMLQRAKVPAGASELPAVKMPPAAPAAPAATGAPGPLPVSYSDEQAGRGAMLFRRHCMFCHTVGAADAKGPDEPLRGFDVGTTRMVSGAVSGRSIRGHESVYHLFVRIRDAMPAWDIESISPAQKLDIVAYLLQQGGFPAAKADLPMDPAILRRMKFADAAPTVEPGFKALFNGRDFTGMTFLFGMNCTPAPEGCGKTTPESFHVEDGMIVGRGRQHGYWSTAEKFKDFELRLEFRWVPPADHEPGDEHFSTGSSGYLLFGGEHRMWPRAIEIEGDNDGIMRAAGMAVSIKQKYDAAAAVRANKGPGYWNEVRILSAKGQVQAYLNGTLTNVIEHEIAEAGYILFQYQGGTIMWRNIRIRAD